MSVSFPIQYQEVVAVVERTSRIPGGEQGDVVTIHTLLQLVAPPSQNVTLVLPVYARDQVDAVLQPIDQVEARFTFNDPVPIDALPEPAREQYREAIERLRKALAAAEEAALKFAYRQLYIREGSQELRFEQQFVVAEKDGEYSFKMFLPLQNTPLQQGGVIRVWVILPPGAVGTLESSGGGQYQGSIDAFGRHIHAWTFQADPVLTVTYRYQ